MKSAVLPPLRRGLLAAASLLLSLALLCDSRVAAEPPSGAAPPPPPALSAPPPPLTAAQLDELVAPVALYPDIVLNSLLPASTVPSDVGAAAAFVVAHGGAVEAAPADSKWDPSVVALLQFPDVLRWMGENPAWVEQMGFAVYTQQADVLAAIQRYRAKARAAGVLASDEHQTVVVQRGAAEVVVIEPAAPNVVYVPSYDPWILSGGYVGGVGLPFYDSWFGFSFGVSGSWCRNRIFWGFGIYDYGSPWYWGHYHSSASYWGPHRPTRWYGPHEGEPRWSHSDWKGPPAGGMRPKTPHFTSPGMSSRRAGIAPTPRMYGPSTLPPTTSTGPGSPKGSMPRWSQPSAPAAPVTRWPGGKATSGAGTVPSTTLPRTYSPGVKSAPRTYAPAPRFSSSTPRVYNRGTVSGWSARGQSSLQGGTRSVSPTPVVRSTPRISVPSTPHFKAPSRVMPPARLRANPVPSGQRTQNFSSRGSKSLKRS